MNVCRRIWIGTLILSAVAAMGLAQQDPLQGRWEGMVRAPQGERPAKVTFKKEGDTYSGTISGVSGTTEIPFKEVKLEGDKVTAKLQIDSPQGSLVVNFEFVVKGDTLTGKGDLNLGAQVFSFTYEMKRVGDIVAQVQQTPVQKLDYFVGQWSFDWVGRESPLGPGGTTKATMTFSKVLEGKFIESRIEGKTGDVAWNGTSYFGYDTENKFYTYFEAYSTGLAILSTGTWTGPGIRLESVPLKVQGQTVRLRRALSIISESTFTLKEEFSVDGGPYQRLGNGTITKIVAETAKSDPK